MENNKNINKTLDYLISISNNPIVVDNKKLENIVNQQNTKAQPIIIKTLIIIGAILTCFFSLGFLFLTGILSNPTIMIVLGLVLILGAIYFTSKIQAIFLDTILLSFYFAGYGLLGYGLLTVTESTAITSLSFFALSAITLIYCKNYIIIFSSTLLLLGSIKVLILEINPVLDGLYFCLLAIITAYFLLNEAKVITWSRRTFQLYDAIKTALTIYLLLQFTPLSGLFYYNPDLTTNELLIIKYTPWAISFVLIFLIIYISSKILHTLTITSKLQKVLIYLCIIIALGPTAIEPSIATSILVLLTCYFIKYKTGVALGILSFIYFISRFYYDMEITLLNKSIALLISGILFLIIYYTTNKHLSSYEKD